MNNKITEDEFYEKTDGETEYFAVTWLLEILNGEISVEQVRKEVQDDE